MTESEPKQESPQANAEAQPVPENGEAQPAPSLEAQLEEAQQKCEQYLNLAKQKQADFENYQKRIQRDLTQERKFASGGLARDLLPALDNLERATVAAQQAGEQGPLVEGVAIVYKQLLDIFKSHGVTQVESVGQPFDPNVHEAVSQMPTNEHPPSTVIQVVEQGYLIHDRVLRPPKVIISIPAVEAKPESEAK